MLAPRLLLALLFAAPATLAADILVPSAEPTIQAGVDAAQPGDVVIVAPGEYPEAVAIAGKDGVIVRSLKPGAAVLAGGDAGFTVQHSVGVVLDGFTIRDSIATGVVVDGESQGVVVRRVVVTDVGGNGLFLDGFDHRVEHCTVADVGANGVALTASKTVVEHCAVSVTGIDGFFVRGDHLVVRDCTAVDVGNNAVQIGSSGSPGIGCVVEDNVFTGGAMTAVKIEDGRDHVVRRNRIKAPGLDGIAAKKGTRGALIAENRIDKAARHGVLVDDASAHVVANVIRKSVQDGVRIEDDAGPSRLLENRVIAAGGAGVRLRGGNAVLIRNRAKKSGAADLADEAGASVLTGNVFKVVSP